MNIGEDRLEICNGSENIAVQYDGGGKIGYLDIPKYVCCNIPGPGTDTANFEDCIQGCSCDGGCCSVGADTDCTCFNKYGIAYDGNGRLQRKVSGEIVAKPITECNINCTCGNTCANKVVQKGLRYKLEVYRDGIKGLCLRSLEHIEANSFVCEYAGEVLTETEAKTRARAQTASDMNYIFVLREHCASGVLKTYVDPCNIGNVGRFLNHSCDPNLFMIPVRVLNYVPKLCLFSIRDISAGEELTYDYAGTSNPVPSMTYSTDAAPSSATNYSPSTATSPQASSNLKPCACMSIKCRGVLPFDPSIL